MNPEVEGMPIDPAALEKFVDALPRPSVLKPVGRIGSVDRYRVSIQEFSAKLHRDLPPTRLWGYEASYPGPSFDVQAGKPIDVEWVNDLPREHLLPLDWTTPGAPAPGESSVRTVVHLHGGHVSPKADGHPEEFLVPGEHVTYRYGNGDWRWRPSDRS